MKNAIITLNDFIHSMTDFIIRSPRKPVAAVLPASSPLAQLGQPSIMGLSIAADNALLPSQVLFFTCPQEFTRYTSQIRK